MRRFTAKNPSFLKRSLADSKGVTLLEAVLAMGLVGVIALASLSFFSDVSQVSHRSRESCRLYNLAFLERIRSYGAIAGVANFTPMPSANVITPSNAPAFALPKELSDAPANRWPNEPILSMNSIPTTEPYINNSLLIDGYMNILQGLWAKHPNICNSYTRINGTISPDPTSLVVPYPEDLVEPPGKYDAGLEIKIVPFDINTGELQLCSSVPAHLRIAPRGAYLKDDSGTAPFLGAAGEQFKVRKPTDVRMDLGFSVQVQSHYVNEQGQADSCMTEGRFQYDIDLDAPPQPQVLSITGSGTPPPCSPENQNSYTLDVGYDSNVPPNKIEPGTVLLCQDLSIMPTSVQSPVLGVSTYYGMQCFADVTSYAPASSGRQVSFDRPFNNYFPTPGYTGFNYMTGSGFGSMIPPKWVPCPELTLCGVSPMSTGGVTNTSSAPGAVPVKLSYQLKYQNLPSDCRIVVRVAGMDTAANPSVVNSPTYHDNSASEFVGWDVPRPRCNLYCPVGPWPNGYFTCDTHC